jgi:ethanolamine utilization protein EutN
MDIGKIIGTVVATRKDPSLIGMRLLMVQPLDESKKSIGTPLVAVDTQGVAGYGDVIYMVTGGDAVNVLPSRRMPVDVAIVGIVDSITLSHPKHGDE